MSSCYLRANPQNGCFFTKPTSAQIHDSRRHRVFTRRVPNSHHYLITAEWVFATVDTSSDRLGSRLSTFFFYGWTCPLHLSASGPSTVLAVPTPLQFLGYYPIAHDLSSLCSWLPFRGFEARQGSDGSIFGVAVSDQYVYLIIKAELNLDKVIRWRQVT